MQGHQKLHLIPAEPENKPFFTTHQGNDESDVRSSLDGELSP